MGLANSGVAIKISFVAFEKTSSSLVKDCLLPTQYNDVRALDDFFFFIKRLQLFRDYVLAISGICLQSAICKSHCIHAGKQGNT